MSDRVLYLDTTTEVLMAGIGVDGAMRARIRLESTSQRYHSAVLIPTLKGLVAEAGLQMSDLTAMAVNQGPGSFTGVRTGISTARTMGQFLNIPVYLINHFELRAYSALAQGASGPVTVVLDALRGRLYAASLDFTPQGPHYPMPPALVSQESWQPPATGTLLVTPSLGEAFDARMPRVFDSDWFSPETMQALSSRYADYYARSWPEVKPLYLQEPNITLRKATPGRC